MKQLSLIVALWLVAQAALAQTAFAQILLREDTASQIVSLGPFLDPADGTAEGGLTIDAADVRLKVNGGADAAKNSGGCTHDVNGMYDCTFDATDTATVGRLNVSVCETGAVCVRQNFLVVEEAVFDACCVAAAAPLTAAAVVDNFETQSQADPTGFHVNVMEVNGTSQTANDMSADANTIVTAVGTSIPGTITTLQTSVNDVPTVAEFEARTIVAANYFDPAADSVLIAAGEATEIQAAAAAALNAENGANFTAIPSVPVASYTNAAGDVCLFVISETEPHVSVDCTEAP